MLRKQKLPDLYPSRESVDQGLQSIYATSEGESADLTKLDMRKKSGVTKILIWTVVTLIILAGAAWGGYVVFQRVFTGSSETLSLTISGPDEVKSGEAVAFDVQYQNTGSVPLANLEINLHLPKGLTLTKTDPAPTSAPDVWEIGSVSRGSDGLIHIEGIWIDPVPSGQTLQAIATYRPANFSSDFQAIATKTVAINTSVLEINAVAGATAVPGTPIDVTYTLKNVGKVPINNARLRLTFPSSFIVTASDPAPREGGSSEWVIDSLAPEGEAAIKITGTFAADASGLQAIHASVGLMRDQDYLEQAFSDSQTDVIGGGLSLRLISNGSAEDQTVDLGSTMRLSIDATNGGTDALSGLEITLLVSTASKNSGIDWAEADLSDGKLSVNTVTWNGSDLSKGGLLPFGDRETIDLSLPLLNALGAASDAFTLTVTATVTDIAGVSASRSVQSTPLHVLLNSEAALSATAHYFEDQTPVGTGPLPPEVGQTTSYRIYWTVDNSLHALDGVVVSATLPPNVTYQQTAETDMGDLSYDSATRTMSWTIDRLPTSVTHVGTSFDLAITPGADEVGKFVKLTNETTLKATDSKTTANLQRATDELTTELPTDPEAAGKGTVSGVN